MYKYLLLLLLSLQACNAQNNTSIEKHLVDTKEFSEAVENYSSQQLVDVRTPGEFNQGHIPNAINYDWRENDFKEQIKNLDKSQPVYVYCQSGVRSSEAANLLVSEGFEVFELKGGMLNWRSKKLPESSDVMVEEGMTMEDYNQLVQDDKLILIDFYADWCAPCKKMEPFLDKINQDMAQDVKVIRIDVEANRKLSLDLKISAIPILRLYKNGEMVWEQNGFIEENALRENINKFK